MTKEITKTIILQQLQDKFKLRELVPEKFTFSEMVIPTYAIDSHLLKREITREERSITAIGSILFHTVPKNERWIISRYTVVFMAEGAYKVTGVFVTRFASVSAYFVYLDMTKGQAASYTKNLPQPIILDAGDMMSILIDDYTSTAALQLHLDITKEEVR